MRRLRPALVWLAFTGAALGPTGCRPKSDTSAEAFGAAVTDYLAKRGTLCVGKPTWPIDVTESAASRGSRDAIQLPVLERLGLVTSSVETVAVPGEEGSPPTQQQARRYRLTDDGMRYYVQAGPDGHRDLCAAKLTLDHVVSFALDDPDAAEARALVKYTYRVDAFPWTTHDEAAKVFPAVAQVIRGAGSSTLEETFRRTPGGWIAVDLGGGPS
jgi:hypothetical protein